VRYAALIAICAVLLAGCGDGDDGPSAQGTTDIGSATTSAATAAPTASETTVPPRTPGTTTGAETGSETTPPAGAQAERVVRAWLEAMNAGDNERAATFFARGATVTEGRRVSVLNSRDEAVIFNESISCGREVRSLFRTGDAVAISATLKKRPGAGCANPGTRVNPSAMVRNGKIVLLDLGRPPPTS
jgi:hypothetical protein